ncbi:MAG: hypothetical protein E4H20_02660 [Spirochaetales bacterium]|nr:MAG: hypothetical protein E4H20_02660 [Spirochaetales bacterium]
MLKLLTMKKLASVALRFIVSFILAEMLMAVYAGARGFLLPNSGSLLDAAAWGMGALVPFSVLYAACCTFFTVNRLFSQRIAVYPLLFILSFLVMAGPAAIIRFVLNPQALGVVGTIVGTGLLGRIGSWYLVMARAEIHEVVPAFAAFCLYISSLWSLSRISRSRPLAGAILTPSACIGAIVLFGVFLEGPAEAVFRVVGLNLSRSLDAAILCGASGLGLLVFDALVSARPEGSLRNA